MSPIVSPVTSKLSRVYQHMIAHMKRLLSRIHGLPRKETPETKSLSEGTPMTSVQWQLDNPYSEKPLYRQTVVYVDLNSQDTSDADKKTTKAQEPAIKITHYPPTHRLH